VDIGLLKENIIAYFLMFSSFTAVTVARIYAIVYNDATLNNILYIDVTAVSCSLFLLLQIIKFIQQKSVRGIGWLFVAGITGGIGLACISSARIGSWLCGLFGSYFGPKFWWYIFSDIAIVVLELYFFASAKFSNNFNYTYEPLTVIV